MTHNIVAYGTIFDAVGCTLNYDSKSGSLAIMEAPKPLKKVVAKAIDELKHYDPSTANYSDGMAALCVADFVDNEKNPVDSETRDNILHALGVYKDGKYIRQMLVLQKNNRSWHFSDTANSCSAFGEECTHRGINPNPNRMGRRSNRKPQEYHVLDKDNNVKREQLVSNGLETLVESIPHENLISGRIPVSIERFDMKHFKSLDVSEQVDFIAKLKESVHA